MKFFVYYCEEDNYSQMGFEARVEKRMLFHRDGRRLEVELRILPEVKGHSDDRFDVLFFDKNTSLPDNDRKYFTKATWWQRRKLKFQFNDSWIQRSDSNWFKQALLTGLLGISGYFIGQNIGYKVGLEQARRDFQNTHPIQDTSKTGRVDSLARSIR